MADQTRAIAPILKRSDEIAVARPKIAYYCRLYAVMSGMKIEKRSPELSETLDKALAELEQAKKTLGKELDETRDEMECETFALQIFDKADRADRAGSREMNTAKMYYAASIFFNVLRQFDADGELEGDIAQKQRYAEWRAAEITKAARSGSTAPPPPEDEGEASGAAAMAPPAPQEMPPSHFPSPPGVTAKPPPPPPAPSPVRVPGGAPPGVRPPPVDIGSVADAQRYAKDAVSALGFEDVHTAVDALTRALEILKPIAK
ncbi:Vacuolar protein sorting-associate protein Vta1/Callose synthase, N-terminal domain [Ostreococcus tauri]|uniref:Vacuolar protein sorting-associate protein Vta1/Callose synthase, N-terminal domain n=1 Tax=Ostreococcus tauri TaxID=70448 RepID=A0A096PA27_OSTTA|nr:Vacuolar protein sorting-associate protein Vta1/Callose synthase, N-terminal domain [Ostreococcus tauri]CEG01793.1 Vacuolar protein sorting-associate protein Vta1/Callose synthase, N-terminal domain [Ostreococcus tauri]|eukprot:XP_022841173.1 Vacuolar protein sorting-associate protein Vta1/Callose synthase, N-terminal domain [Ostreococcus tauri]